MLTEKRFGLIGPGVTEVLMDPVGRESRYVKYVNTVLFQVL